MTDAYKDYAKSAVRGVLFTNNRRELIVRDEVKMKSRTDLWWFAHTKADITLSTDGKPAILSEGGKQMWVGILSGGEAKFEVMEARFIKIIGYGSNVNAWNNIAEVR